MFIVTCNKLCRLLDLLRQFTRPYDIAYMALLHCVACKTKTSLYFNFFITNYNFQLHEYKYMGVSMLTNECSNINSS